MLLLFLIGGASVVGPPAVEDDPVLSLTPRAYDGVSFTPAGLDGVTLTARPYDGIRLTPKE